MLQQTQVATVLPYFERWLQRWPDFASLAAAEEAQVLQMWEGLGYYSRARNLLKLARAWVAATAKPQSAAEWLAYPGVGPYTSAAIASIAFGEHAAVVDGNVVRILTRLSADTTAYPGPAHAVRAVTPLAQALIAPAEEPGLHNEAMMELGATLCRKGQPQCLLCPVRAFCRGQTLGQDLAQLPKIARKATINRVENRVLVVDSDSATGNAAATGNRDTDNAHGNSAADNTHATGDNANAGAADATGRILLCRYGADSRRLAGLSELPRWELLHRALTAVSTTSVAAVGADAMETDATPAPPVSLAPLLVRHRSIANERIEERIYAVDLSLADKLALEAFMGATPVVAKGTGRSARAETVAAAASAGETLFWQRLDALGEVTLTGPHRRWLATLLKPATSR